MPIFGTGEGMGVALLLVATGVAEVSVGKTTAVKTLGGVLVIM